MPDQTTSVGMERKLAAIFSTDVAGYSRLMGRTRQVRSSACGRIARSCSSRRSSSIADASSS